MLRQRFYAWLLTGAAGIFVLGSAMVSFGNARTVTNLSVISALAILSTLGVFAGAMVRVARAFNPVAGAG